MSTCTYTDTGCVKNIIYFSFVIVYNHEVTHVQYNSTAFSWRHKFELLMSHPIWRFGRKIRLWIFFVANFFKTSILTYQFKWICAGALMFVSENGSGNNWLTFILIWICVCWFKMFQTSYWWEYDWAFCNCNAYVHVTKWLLVFDREINKRVQVRSLYIYVHYTKSITCKYSYVNIILF